MTPYRGKLAIVTSFYSYHAYSPYVISLAHTLGVLSKLGIDWDYIARPADFHVERALNNTLTELMERDDFTDVLLIDSDESWRPEDVVRLLLHPQEIVGGAYRMKNRDQEYVGSLRYEDGCPVGIKQPDGSYLLEAERVAAGFMRVRIAALRKWAAYYPELVSDEPDGKKVQFFNRMVAKDDAGNNVVHCQDMAFCRRWREKGERLWIDPMVKVDHWWTTCYPGDFDKHLRDQKKTKEAFAIVEQMAKDIAARA